MVSRRCCVAIDAANARGNDARTQQYGALLMTFVGCHALAR